VSPILDRVSVTVDPW